MIKIIKEDIKKIIKLPNLNFFNQKKILIFGASGIVGQYFLIFFLELLNKKHAPLQITLIFKNKIPDYLKFLRKNKRIKIIQCNINYFNFTKIKKHDLIIFAGGYGQPSKFLEKPIETIKLHTNVLIKFIKKLNKGGKFLYLSSSEVYNNNNKSKLTENDIGFTNTKDHRASYIESKRCGETIINIFRDKFKIDAKSIRLSLSYGPGAKKNDGRVLYQFIERSLKYKTLTVKDDGSAIRRYIYISDAIKMMINIILYGKKSIYNVAGKEKTSIAEIARKIATVLKISVKFEKKQPLLGAPKNISLSIKRYEDEFGKQKLISLNKGLKKTITWYQKHKY